MKWKRFPWEVYHRKIKATHWWQGSRVREETEEGVA